MTANEILRIYGTEYRDMTVRLLQEADLIGEIRKKAGLTGRGPVADNCSIPEDFLIGIKPNLVTPNPAIFGGTTHPEIVEGILSYLLDHGLKKEQLMILEGSWVGDRTEEAFDYCGYFSLAERYGVVLKDLQKEKRIDTVSCAGMDLQICSLARELDFLINVPVLKGHCQTKVTCALKNMKGVIPNSEKRRFHRMGLHKPIAHLNAGIRQDFIVIDHICGDPDFEEGGNPLVRNCIMAAEDPVLTDAYTCRILGYDPSEVSYITLAARLGLGSCDLDTLSLRTLEGTIPEEEPQDGRLSGEKEASGQSPETRKLVDIAYAVEEIDSCSACYGTLLPALERLRKEGLLDLLVRKLDGAKIGIGQGYRGRTGLLGVGNCTAGFRNCIRGCPPKEEEIFDALKRFLEA